MPVRANEQAALEKLARHLPVKLDRNAPYFKTSVLLQAHFSRTPLTADLRADQRAVLMEALRLLQVRACVRAFVRALVRATELT